jgi:hypothetical protein
MSAEQMPKQEKTVSDEYEKLHEKAKMFLGDAYDEAKLDAIMAARDPEVVMKELSSLPEAYDASAWYDEEENKQALEMFGK